MTATLKKVVKEKKSAPTKTATEKPPRALKAPPKKGVRIQYEHTYHITQEELLTLPIYAPISRKQEVYLQDQEHDIVVWGGAASAGKTQLSLIRILLCAMYDSHYVAAIARRSQKQMKSAGSLWSSGCKMFNPHGVMSNKVDLTWTFPNGAEVKCHHLDDNQDDWQGTQCTEFVVDESQQCKEDDVWYLTSRLRSMSKKKHQLRLTSNPLNTSFLCDWLTKAGYLLPDGLPDPERDGKTTWMMQVAGEFVWYSTYEECKDMHGEEDSKMALKFVFYSANVYDNPWVRKELPSYVHKLENLKSIDRSRLLLGNWYCKEEGDGYIDRDWFKPVMLKDVPLGLPTIRCWDFAGTKPHSGNKNPDWTRGVKCAYDREWGYFYILGMESIRDSPAMVEDLLTRTAYEDGHETYIGIPVDAGAAGKVVAEQKRAKLLGQGFRVLLTKTSSSKLVRAEPFLIALQQGKVFVADSVFNKEHYNELESFDGARNSGAHDDIVDALADCYTYLTTNKLIPSLRIDVAAFKKRNVGGNTLLRSF